MGDTDLTSASVPEHGKKDLHRDFRVVLFDIDGTLIRATRRGEFRDLTCRMLTRIFGTEGRIREIDFAGKTDLAIYREALECAGISSSAIQEKISLLESAVLEILDLLSAAGPIYSLCAGVPALLEALSRDARFVPSLLTGNFEKLAEAKLRSAGIGHYFPLRGAYGSDAEDRNKLPAIAASRLQAYFGRPIPPARIIIVGDTPRDVACARHFGTRVLAVASGRHSIEELRECVPEAVLPDLNETNAVLRLLAGEGGTLLNGAD